MGANQGHVPNPILEAVKNRPPVGEGKTRICVCGFKVSHHTGRAKKIADEIQKVDPGVYETWAYFSWYADFHETVAYLKEHDFQPFIQAHPNHHISAHRTSPIVWLEKNGENGVEITPIGGRDRFCEWAMEKYKDVPSIGPLITTEPTLVGDAWVDETPGTTQPQRQE